MTQEWDSDMGEGGLGASGQREKNPGTTVISTIDQSKNKI